MNAEQSVRAALMNSLWTSCMIVQAQWKFENQFWVIVSYKSFNVRPGLDTVYLWPPLLEHVSFEKLKISLIKQCLI